jgi:hypothetical protein
MTGPVFGKGGPKIFAALVAAQKSITGVVHDAENTFAHYKYTSSETIIAAGRKALNAHGLALIQKSRLQDREDNERRLDIDYLLIHEPSSETMVFETDTAAVEGKGRPVDKAESGALTLSLAYFYRGLLSINRPAEAGEEVGGEHVDQRDDRKHTPKPRAPKKPTPRTVVERKRKELGFTGPDVKRVAALCEITTTSTKWTEEQADQVIAKMVQAKRAARELEIATPIAKWTDDEVKRAQELMANGPVQEEMPGWAGGENDGKPTGQSALANAFRESDKPKALVYAKELGLDEKQLDAVIEETLGKEPPAQWTDEQRKNVFRELELVAGL